jgi:arylsulfatase A-like enzyme
LDIAMKVIIAALTVLMLPLTSFAAERPNIVYIMIDDAGCGDLGGKVIQTPNFDRLCREGTRFTQHYCGSAVCAPTRCALMTGLHTGHGRRRDNTAVASFDDFSGRPLVFLEPEDLTVAETLHSAGYVTAGIGKWGLGNPGTDGEPAKQGFDHWFGYLDQVHAHDQFPTELWSDDRMIELPENRGADKTYAHDRFESETLKFLRQQNDKPFFLYLAYTLPHGEYVIPHDDPAYALYRDRSWPQPIKNYAAMVTRVDRTVGKVLDLLTELSLADNTIVFYTSDNGPNRQFAETLDSARGFRGLKTQLYEGGLRSNMAVRYPGRTPAGATSDFVWSMVDFFPTACELAGIDKPSHLDGMSVLPTLTGKKQPPHEWLYWEIHHPFQQAVRLGDWKGIRFGTKERLELYDLARDPQESQNVGSEHPEVVAKIERILDTARSDSRYWPAVEHRKQGNGRQRGKNQ